MDAVIITKLQKTFEDCAQEADGIEFWFARQLQVLLGYVEWQKFQGVIEKAKDACKNSGYDVNDHFVDVAKKVKVGSEAEQDIKKLERRVKKDERKIADTSKHKKTL